MVAGTPLTLRIGFIAGFLGVGIGSILGFVSAYYRGIVDTLIRGIADVGLTVPGLLVLIIIAVSIKEGLTVNQMALVVASLAWLNPTRTIRAQVLTLRERGYVEVARLSGMSGPEIIFKELMPNLLPYLGATLVNAVSNAILASIGLEVLGLGPIESPTLGMTLYWVNYNAALINGWWWWWAAPIVIILIVFLGSVLPHRGPGRDRQPQAPEGGMTTDVLRVQGLVVHYHTPLGAVKAADDVSFSLRAEERLGFVGESGSGKSTMALAILRMIKPPGRIEAGEVWLDGVNVMTPLRGGDAAGPIGADRHDPAGVDELAEPGDAHRGADRRRAAGSRGPAVHAARWRSGSAISSSRSGCRPEVAEMYPHELSGGMKQRVCIAIAISLRPKVIIADEPTSALDVVVQKQVMETLARVQKELDASVILVGHDMGLMAQFVDRLGVMYAGKLVEVSPVRDIFTKPLHPYTQMLIASLPSLEQKGTFRGIPGLAPLLRDLPPGCAFHPRCPQALDRCRTEAPQFKEARPDTWAACHLL